MGQGCLTKSVARVRRIAGWNAMRIGAFLVLLAGPSALAAAPSHAASEREVVVGLAGASEHELRRAGARSVKRIGGLEAAVVTIRGQVAHNIARIESLSGVRYVEPNHVHRSMATANDPLLSKQWALRSDRGIDVAPAWEQGLGGEVTIAVIDTGVDLGHPDLRGNIWTNPGEIPGNGHDDDGNGRVDDVHGFDFVNGDGDPSDDNGHGTHVAGTAAAEGGNGVGVAGVAWRARIMSLKALDSESAGTVADAARAIRYAADNGARIVNTSFNGPGRSTVLEEAISYAESRGVLIAASAGNDGQNIDAQPSYPASYPHGNVIATASTGTRGTLSSFSNRGRGSVDIAAPGEDILSTANGGAYERRWGTSMATPHVAGTLLLMAAAKPGISSPDLTAALLGTASRSRALDGDVSTGALNAAAAVHTAVTGARKVKRSKPARPRLRFPTRNRRVRSRSRKVTLRWRSPAGVRGISRYVVYLNGRRIRTVRAARRGARPRTATRTRARRGRNRWRVVVYDRLGGRRGSRSGSFRVVR